MKPLAIIIMDGFGLGSDEPDNAIARARKPNLDRIWKNYATTSLGSSGLSVGLPRGQMGNSEVGHLNLGGGRIVYQDYTRISLAVEEGTLCQNAFLLEAMRVLQPAALQPAALQPAALQPAALQPAALQPAALRSAKDGKLHLIGLLSDGGVHSHITHLFALLDMAKAMGLREVYVHAILDGRDVPPKSALTYFGQLEEKLKQLGIGRVATVSGRYYTMDRDKRWDRVERAYLCLTEGTGFHAKSAEQAVQDGYDRGESDEFLKPTVVDPDGMVDDGDSIIFFNFRPDRAREITRAFVDESFTGFPRRQLKVRYTCMTQYDATLNVPVAFPPQNLVDTLGEVVSRAGLRQLRLAETEKYAHVTYFFNGGKEAPNPGEDRILIPSPKVATYDLKPEMSAYEVTDEVVRRIRTGGYDLIVLNYANPDMVGHTGIFEAAVKAIEVVDNCVGRVVAEVLAQGSAVLLTADHGNAEKMEDAKTGQPHTAHTTNRVPFSLIIDDGIKHVLRDDGILADVAPTAMELMNIPKPAAMTGRSLILK